MPWCYLANQKSAVASRPEAGGIRPSPRKRWPPCPRRGDSILAAGRLVWKQRKRRNACGCSETDYTTRQYNLMCKVHGCVYGLSVPLQHRSSDRVQGASGDSNSYTLYGSNCLVRLSALRMLRCLGRPSICRGHDFATVHTSREQMNPVNEKLTSEEKQTCCT
jgi:hypothetical protein